MLMEGFQIKTSNEETEPYSYTKPYSTEGIFSQQFECWKVISATDKKQVLLFKHYEKNKEKKSKFILKRYVQYFDDIKSLDGNNPELQTFLNNHLIEFEMSQRFSTLFTNANVIEYQITYIEAHIAVVFEILIDYLGISLLNGPEIESENNDLKILNIIRQLAIFLEFCENTKLTYNNLYLSNIYLFNDQLVRIGDFSNATDLSKEESQHLKRIRHPHPYTAPEIFDALRLAQSEQGQNKNNDNGKGFNPWKADVYSFGLCCLVLLKCIKNEEIIYGDDNNLEKKNNYLIKSAENMKITSFPEIINVELKASLKKLVISCLNLNPSERDCPKGIVKLLNELILRVQKLLIEGMPRKSIDQFNDLNSKKRKKDKIKAKPKILLQGEKFNVEFENMLKNFKDPLIIRLNGTLNEKEVKVQNLQEPVLELVERFIRSKSESYERKARDEKKILELEEKLKLSYPQLNLPSPPELTQNIQDEINSKGIPLKIENLPSFRSLIFYYESQIKKLLYYTTCGHDESLRRVKCYICDRNECLRCLKDCIQQSNEINDEFKKELRSGESMSFKDKIKNRKEALSIVNYILLSNTLTHVDFSNCKNVDEEAGYLLKGFIKCHPTLKSFAIDNTAISGHTQIEIALQAKTIPNIEWVRLDHDEISEKGAEKLSQALNCDYNEDCIKLNRWNKKILDIHEYSCAINPLSTNPNLYFIFYILYFKDI